ncbi:MAG: hypothetical protein GDA56_07380 [Hormoscilla sp. GM7CHS1pb]|nr:hypothetical protein [Hormoscilla sp. GM7CHS1pb]
MCDFSHAPGPLRCEWGSAIAHEINNPVSFITGNLTHVKGYRQDLLRLGNLYWHHYQQPVPEIQSEVEASDLFDPFFTTKPPGKGTGLGLSVSYQIVVEKHGNQLQFISQPGQGTEFVISIPIRQKYPTSTNLKYCALNFILERLGRSSFGN